MAKSLSELTQSDFDEIQMLAGLFFTPKNICKIVQFDLPTFLQHLDNPTSKIAIAFNTGWLMAEAELRTAVKKLATSGSGPAQAMLHDMMKLSLSKIKDR